MHAPCHLLRAVAAIKLVIYGLGLISKGKIASVLHSTITSPKWVPIQQTKQRYNTILSLKAQQAISASLVVMLCDGPGTPFLLRWANLPPF